MSDESLEQPTPLRAVPSFASGNASTGPDDITNPTGPGELTRAQLFEELKALRIIGVGTGGSRIIVKIDSHDAALRAQRDALKEQVKGAVERSQIVLKHFHDVCEQKAELTKERDALQGKLAEAKDRIKFLDDVFERHSAREKYMAEIAFQHIKHGDEKHQEWLRKELVEVLCKEKTKACQTFDDLTAKLAASEQAYNDLVMQVYKKFPGESLHDTAKRYIQQHEQYCGQGGPVQGMADKEPS